MKKSELLVPVGNFDTLMAALKGGADAVYLGGKRFGARAYADNFDDNQLIEAINLCHTYNVKVYITVNTMIYNNEFNDVLEYINFLYINGVDAVILQDIGLIHYVRKYFPLLDVHVSTQGHVHNNTLAEYYYNLGCKRVVFDREMSLDLINDVNVPIEKEVFVFGALCVCYSGNCLFSALNGGRSANRGMCVGSCRLPYSLYNNDSLVDNGFLLSTKDLNTLNYLKRILDSNIDSLKIEGRMKSKEYVYVTTSLYRKLIDNYYDGKELFISDEDVTRLKLTYNRGFTKGFLFDEESIINKKTSNHQGVMIGKVISVNNKKIGIKLSANLHQGDAIRFGFVDKGMFVNSLYDTKDLLVNSISNDSICYVDNKDRIMYKDLIDSPVLKTFDYLISQECDKAVLLKKPINMIFDAHLNSKMSLSIIDGDYKVIVYGELPAIAENRPINKEKILEQLSKLGSTSYYLNDCDINIDDNLFINIKDLNELRRSGIDKLNMLKITKRKIVEYKLPVNNYTNSNGFKISVLVRNEEQLLIALKNNVDYVYVLDYELYKKYRKYDSIYYVLDRVNNDYVDFKNERLLCTEFGSVINYGKDNVIRASYGLNIANDVSVDVLKKLNCKMIGLSLEFEDNIDIKNRDECEILVYGKPLCMVIKNNIFNYKNDKMYLSDMKGKKYPIISDDKFTYIYSDHLIDRLNKVNYLKGFGALRIDLFDEDAFKTQLIISKVKNIRGD